MLLYKSAGVTSRYQLFNIKTFFQMLGKRIIPCVTAGYRCYLKNLNGARVPAVSVDPNWDICI